MTTHRRTFLATASGAVAAAATAVIAGYGRLLR
jgi:hypothetical protein